MSRRQKKRKARKRKKSWMTEKIPAFPTITVKKWLSTLILIFFFLFSLLAVGYVVFFRTVLAEEIDKVKRNKIVFEEPFAPIATEVVQKVTVTNTKLPRIAIIIDDMGYDETLGLQLLSLNMHLSFSFLPFAPFTPDLEEIAHKLGKTILLHLPMQPRNRDWDPGVGALYLNGPQNKLKELFKKDLESVPHAIGVNNHMGSLYTENTEAMTKLLSLIKERDLFYIDSFTSSKSVGMSLAIKTGVKTARRNVFLDNVLSEEEVCKQLDKLVETAEKLGHGIGIGHPNQVTLAALSKCMKKANTRVKLVNVTELLR